MLEDWNAGLGAPPFDRIAASDFLPALLAGIALHRAEIEAVATDLRPADFDNSVAALERAGKPLSLVRRVFWMLASAHAGPEVRALENEVGELLTRHATSYSHDPRLFARIAAVWRDRDGTGLNAEQWRLLDNVYRGFIMGGAQLDEAGRQRFAAIDERLQSLSVSFGQNVLAAATDWELWLDAADLGGVPDSLRASAAQRAVGRGQAGRFLFTLDRGDFEGVLSFADRRDVRETMWRGFTDRCDGGTHDNRPLIAEILALRTERAALLGFASHADYALDDSMAQTPAAAAALLERVWMPAHVRALEEVAELQAFAEAQGAAFELAAWDLRYYAEQVRRARYALDGAAVRAHLPLDAVRAAAFDAARRLYGLRFERRELPVYHPDVASWSVAGADGAAVGLLYTDDIARSEKRGGAWMGSLRVQERDGGVLPIVYTVANFARAPAGQATRLSLDEARTLFHEFGHALHGLLSDVTYPSLAGTAVARDFVEFPSKFMEHWIDAPEVLAGFGVPDDLIAAIGRAGNYGQGMATLEFLASAIVDLEIHRGGATGWAETEAGVLDRLAMPSTITMRHRLPHFTHVFDGGYAAAYYSYLWSEILDADAFEAFVEAGDIFDPRLAMRFRTEILARGDSREPEQSFAAFRGRDPDEGALLRSRGLA